MLAFASLGAQVTLVAPPTLLPPSLAGWPVEVSHDIDAVLPEARRRLPPATAAGTHAGGAAALPPRVHGHLRADPATGPACFRDGALIMHPGPVNRGVEVAAEVADYPASVITRQVANGVAVRMAVLFLLLGSGVDLVAA